MSNKTIFLNGGVEDHATSRLLEQYFEGDGKSSNKVSKKLRKKEKKKKLAKRNFFRELLLRYKRKAIREIGRNGFYQIPKADQKKYGIAPGKDLFLVISEGVVVTVKESRSI